MDVKVAFYSLLLLHILILQGACNGTGGSTEMASKTQTTVTRSPHHHHNARVDMRIEQVRSSDDSSSASHMHHMDSSLIVFFFVEDLKQGNAIPIYFPERDSSAFPHHFLSRQEANAIPFSYRELDRLLRFFDFPGGSPQATAMEDTLRQCEIKPIKGEIKLCATSHESLADFTKMIFGSDTEAELVSTVHITKPSVALQKYTVMRVEKIGAPKSIACHTMPYPYPVLYCHYQASKSRVFRVSLTGENGDEVEAVAVCHMDTSNWSPNHVSFQLLGIEPGSCPVCHFFPADNFVLVPTPSTASMQAL